MDHIFKDLKGDLIADRKAYAISKLQLMTEHSMMIVKFISNLI